MADNIVPSISPSVCLVAVCEASSLSTMILGRRAVIHCMRFGRRRLPGLYPGRGLAYHCNSFTKYIRDAGAFRDLLIIVQFGQEVGRSLHWSQKFTFGSCPEKVESNLTRRHPQYHDIV